MTLKKRLIPPQIITLHMTEESGSHGRVQVYARTRPLSLSENAESVAVEIEDSIDGGKVTLRTTVDPLEHLAGRQDSGARPLEKSYILDGAFSLDTPQKEVFLKVGLPVVVDVMKGFNGCIFAYGQTGSGKTHSLLNSDANDTDMVGLLPRVVATLYVRATMERKYVYQLQAAAVQVYNEQIDDLLNSKKRSGEGMNIPIQQGGVIPNLTWVDCNSANEMLDVFKRARKELIYAETKMNKSSSRSHAVFQIRVTRRLRSTNIATDDAPISGVRTFDATCGQLTIVDLAGSERVKRSGVTGNSFKETTNINGSLLALGNVVKALADKSKHVPFRDSKLTRILEGSVGGNCKTSLLVCISPCESSLSESMATLEFASRAMRVEVNATINSTVLEVNVEALAADIAADNGLTMVDEEMIKSYKENERVLGEIREEARIRSMHIEAITKELHNVRQEINEKDQELEATNKQIKSLTESLESTKHESRTYYQSVELEKKKYEHELSVKEELLKVAEAKVEALNAQNDSIQKSLDIANQELSNTMAIMKRLKAESQQKISALEESLAALRQELEEEQKQSAAYNSQMLEQKETMTGEIDAFTKRIQQSTEMIVKLQSELESKTDELNRLDAIESQNGKLASELTSAHEHTKTIHSQLEAMQKEQKATEIELAIQKEEAKKSLMEMERSKAEMLAMLDTIEEKTHMIIRTNLENDQLHGHIEEVQSKLLQSEESRRALEGQWKSQVQEIVHAEEEHVKSLEQSFQTKMDLLIHESEQRQLALSNQFASEKSQLQATIRNLQLELEDTKERYEYNRKANKESLRMVEENIQEKLEQTRMTEKSKYTGRIAELEQNLQRIRGEVTEEAKAFHKTSKIQMLRESTNFQILELGLKKQINEWQLRYTQLLARYDARDSRVEDLSKIKSQEKRISQLESELRKVNDKSLGVQSELDYYKNSNRMFGEKSTNKGSRFPAATSSGSRGNQGSKKSKNPKRNATIPLNTTPQVSNRDSVDEWQSRPLPPPPKVPFLL